MKWKGLIGLGILVVASAPAEARVRVGLRDGKRVVFNDGIGESVHAVLRESDDWLRARVGTPSLYDDLIDQEARNQSIDPKLVKSVMLVESAFNPKAVSRKGARGLMQLMPETASRHGVRDSFDPAENIRGGARHLAYLVGVFAGDVTKSLAAYNAGEAAVLRYGGVPPYDETRLYVHKALTAYYGKDALSGGFGLPPAQTFGSPQGRSVRVTRDPNRGILLTTEPARRSVARGLR